MTAPIRRKATYQDVLDAPQHVVAEIVAGDLFTSPRPGPRHAIAASVIGGALNPPFHRAPGDPGGPGGWWILYEPELHLGEDVLVPDLAGWRRERMPKIPEEAFFALAPDWICEVLSPATARLDRIQKKRVYAREGVGHLWFVDPLAQTLEVLRLAAGVWQDAGSYEGNDLASVEPFAEVEVDLGRWWA